MSSIPEPHTTDQADSTDRATSTDQEGPAVALAWWRSPMNLVSLAFAIAVLAAGAGWLVGNNSALPDPDATDVGFLQDMRMHHEQAVQISLIYLDTPGTDQALRTTAREIVVGQNIEIGRMIQLLRDYGKAEVNDSDIAMAWMDEPVAFDRMPGLATDDDIAKLGAATGAAADATFVQLMTVHHEGGIHMADHAADHAATAEVSRMARQMAEAQREEIDEMAWLLSVSTS